MKTNHFSGIVFPSNTSQRGIGMVEVLVAMVLLAIGVLGYAALQARAVGATGEALNRSQAMVVLRGLAEEIRVNSTVQSGTGGYPAAVQSFANLSAAPTAPSTLCYSANCTAAQLATFDAYQAAKSAFGQGIKINMLTCPGAVGTNPRQCLFAAWGKTTLAGTSLPSTPGATDCMSSAGVYQPDATCVMMEAY